MKRTFKMSGGKDFFNNNAQNDVASWIVVIICLIAFWPLGLALLLSKINFNKRAKGTGASQNSAQYKAWQAQQGWNRNWQQGWRQHTNQNSQTQAHSPNQAGQDAPQQQQASGVYNTPGQAQKTYTAATPAGGSVKPGKKSKADKKQMPGENLAVVMTLAAFLLSLIGLVMLSTGIGSIAAGGMYGANLGLSIFGGFSLLGGIISAVVRGVMLKRARRFHKYDAIIGNRRVMPVVDIAKAAGEPAAKTRKLLQMMVDAGVFGPSAYIDSGIDSLVFSFEDAEKVRTDKEDAESASEAAENTNPYVAIVNELHMLCAETSDPVICGKIQRIEDITVKIFRLVEEKPEKGPQIRRFMNYYLPTTLKLLHSYETLEKQGVNGENISAAKNDIARVLDTLSDGFEQQLDNLFMSDKIDISADIDVLENLMRQDGLTDDGNIMKPSGGF
jgi:hypothetical protein